MGWIPSVPYELVDEVFIFCLFFEAGVLHQLNEYFDI